MASGKATDWISVAPRWIVALAGGICLFLLALALHFSDAGRNLERTQGLRLLFQARGALKPPSSVALVAIDDGAGHAIGLPADLAAYNTCADLRVGKLPPSYRSLPSAARVSEWPRCVHARAVDALHALGARLIVFDVTFRTRDPHHVGGVDVRDLQDQMLAQAMQRAGNVFLATKVHSLMDQDGHGGRAASMQVSQLTESLRAQAMGVGPVHIADVAPPYGRFHLFSQADGERASVLVQALMFQLRTAFPEVKGAIPGAQAPGSGVPASTEDLLAAGELEATGLQLRQFLRRPPPDKDLTTAHQPPITKAAQRWLAALGGADVRQINLYGPPGTLVSIDYEALLAGTTDLAAKVKDKAVFIGYQETDRPEQIDHFESYYERSDGVHYSGVELAATLYANLLDDATLRTPGHWAVGVLLLFAFVPLGLTVLRPRAWAYGVAVGMGASYLLVAVLLFRQHNLWLPVITPVALILPAALLLGASWQALRQSRRNRELENFLGRLLPREVVERIRSNARRMQDAQTAQAGACVATDVQGFSRLAERLPPNVLVRLMDRYFSALTREVARHDGVVSNIAGDEMIGVWPDRGVELQNCRAACDTCLAVKEAVTRFNARNPRTPLPTRIGAHFGPLTFGSLEGHASLGAFGDTINTASRIQNLNKSLRTQILVSSTVIRAQDEFLARDVGTFVFRNMSRPVRVHELLGRNAGASPDQRRLCAEFAVALASCRDQKVEEGLSLFRALLSRYPDDGPTAFYVQYIAEHPDWPGDPIPTG